MATSSVSFIQGIHVSFGAEAARRGLEQWYLVGYVEREPFYMHYLGMGVANWDAKIQLTPLLRRRILARFKATVRGELFPWLTEFSTDLFSKSNTPEQQILTAACLEFHKTAWRDKMLDDRDEDYVVLNVPYADRSEALATGAKWWHHKKMWVIHKSLDSGAVARWMI